MSNATRYLCAAAYLAPSFATTVISELIGSHRAVAPSRGIDIEPVIRHSLKARRMQLMRDVLLCALLILGVVTAPPALILILIAAFLLSLLPGPDWERKSVGRRVLAGVTAIVVIIIAVVVVSVIAVIFVLIYAVHQYMGGTGLPQTSPGGSALGGMLIIWEIIYACLIAITLVRYSYMRNKTLSEWLQPGASAPAFAPSPDRVETRIAEVAAAQHGNLTLYGGEDPFIGAGITPFTLRRDEERVWSIAIELNREGARRSPFGSAQRGQVRIDPIELHSVLRSRLLQLNDDGLPPNERVMALTVDHHVVGEGGFRWDSPLMDPRRKIPYSRVSSEAVAELIKNPQARLRYYQRVSVSDEGRTVLAGGRPVTDSVDQEVIVSAFVHVAVEGHMFYLQFVPSYLAPVYNGYRVIDRMPKTTSGKFMVKVVMDAARTAFRDIVRAPVGVVVTWRQMHKERRSFEEELTHADDYVYADVGARISVRELGAALLPRTYIQRLDTSKYTKIIERLVIETVLDFLVAKDVDTSAYRASAQAIYNSGVIVAGNNSGAVAFGGGGASATAGR